MVKEATEVTKKFIFIWTPELFEVFAKNYKDTLSPLDPLIPLLCNQSQDLSYLITSFVRSSAHDAFSFTRCLKDLLPSVDKKKLYSRSLLEAVINLKTEERDIIVTLALSLRPFHESFDVHSYVNQELSSIIKVISHFNPESREELLSQARKISNREGGDLPPKNICVDLGVLYFLSKADQSEREDLIRVIAPLLRYNQGLVVSPGRSCPVNLLLGVALGEAWGKINNFYYKQPEFLQDLASSSLDEQKKFLLILKDLNLEVLDALTIDTKQKMVSTLEYAREDNTTAGEDPYSFSAKISQVARYNRAFDLLPRIDEPIPVNGGPPLTKDGAIYRFSELKSAKAQNLFLDLFLPNMTDRQKATIWNRCSHFQDYWREGDLERAWTLTRDVVDPVARITLIEQAISRDHRHLQEGGIVDRENVMNGERVSKTEKALKSLYYLTHDFETPFDLIEKIKKHIVLLELTNKDNALFHRERAGASEISHAFHVLDGKKDNERGDYDSLKENNIYTHADDGKPPYRMLGILGRVWHLINHYHKDGSSLEENKKQRDLLRHSFVTALAQCFDEEGYRGAHRVCNVGKVQRLLTVLQGYFPGIEIDEVVPPVKVETKKTVVPVEISLAELTSQLFNADHSPKVHVEEAEILIEEMAARVYEDNPEERESFISQAQNFLDLLESREIRAEQERAYAASLSADQEKELKNKAAVKIQKAFRKWHAAKNENEAAALAAEKPESPEGRREVVLAALAKRGFGARNE
ncbi:MAG: hypothetical protein ACK5PQ_05285 [Alphaproteobacteria bacterium]